MKILITGCAGFIGSNLAKKFLSDGESILGVDNFITCGKENVSRLLKEKNFTFLEIDITNLESIKELAKFRFDQIYHLASPTGVPNCERLGEEMLLTNSIGTFNVLEIARKNKASFLLASSSEVYGDPQIFPQSEEYFGNVDPIGFRSPYEEGKRFAESLAISYFRKFNVDVRIARIFNTYGPNMDNNDQRVIPRFLKALTKNLQLEVYGDGNQTRTFCYVDDLVNGLVLIMEKGTSGEIYNLGSDQEVSIKKLAYVLLDLTGTKKEVKFLNELPSDPKRRKPLLSKIKKLGWKPKTKLEEGLKYTFKKINSAKI